MPKKKLEQTKTITGLEVPVEWHIPETISSRYATNMVVQHNEHEFILSFFEVRPPLLLGEPNEQLAQLEQIESVRAECVGRIVIASGRMPEFIQVLQTQLQRHASNLAGKE